MNAEFFALAFLAALNPKLFGMDLLLAASRRPRLMFSCFLLGGLGMCLGVGLLDVFVLQADAISTQASASAGLDLALGVPLVVAGILLWTGRLHGRRRAPAPAKDGPPEKDGWARRLLGKPRPGLAVLIGAVAGMLGAAYISAARPDAGIAVHVLPGRGAADGRGPGLPACLGAAGAAARGRAPVEFRRVRLAGTAAGVNTSDWPADRSGQRRARPKISRPGAGESERANSSPPAGVRPR